MSYTVTGLPPGGLPVTKLPWSGGTKLVRLNKRTNLVPPYHGNFVPTNQFGSLGRTDGTSRKSRQGLWITANFQMALGVNDEILMWACVTGTTLNNFLDLYFWWEICQYDQDQCWVWHGYSHFKTSAGLFLKVIKKKKKKEKHMRVLFECRNLIVRKVEGRTGCLPSTHLKGSTLRWFNFSLMCFFFYFQLLRGYCTSYPKISMFCAHLKIIDIFLKSNICILL